MAKREPPARMNLYGAASARLEDTKGGHAAAEAVEAGRRVRLNEGAEVGRPVPFPLVSSKALEKKDALQGS